MQDKSTTKTPERESEIPSLVFQKKTEIASVSWHTMTQEHEIYSEGITDVSQPLQLWPSTVDPKEMECFQMFSNVTSTGRQDFGVLQDHTSMRFQLPKLD